MLSGLWKVEGWMPLLLYGRCGSWEDRSPFDADRGPAQQKRGLDAINKVFCAKGTGTSFILLRWSQGAIGHELSTESNVIRLFCSTAVLYTDSRE